MLKKINIYLLLLLFAGCGYTTRGFLDASYKTIFVKPVVNEVSITDEMQEDTEYRSVPPLIENRFTNALLDRFNLDGNLKASDEYSADLILSCRIIDYSRDAIRFDDSEDVEEQRLRIDYAFTLADRSGNAVKEKTLVAYEEYAQSGSSASTEEAALSVLLDDAARRLVEDIIESW